MSILKKNLWAVLVLAPFVFLLHWVVKFAIDMPYLDEWDMVPYLQKSYEGSLTLHDLFEQHNESRILFPRLMMIPLAHFTGWNTNVEVAGILLLAVLIFLLLARQSLRTSAECHDQTPMWIPVVLSALIFSILQYESWTFGFTFIGFMNILCVIVGFMLLSHPVFSWLRFAGALLFGALAMYSYSNGILYWFTGLLTLLTLSREQHRIRIAPWIVWILYAGMMMSLYFADYQKPSCMPPLRFFIYHPDVFLGYFFALLGGAIANSPQWPIAVSVTIGVIGCMLFLVSGLACFYLAGRPLRAVSFWLSLGTYALLGALVIAVGRSANGIPHALESRYTTLSTLFWISTLVMSTLIMTFVERSSATLKQRSGLWGLSGATRAIKAGLFLFTAVCAVAFLISSAAMLELWRQRHAALLAVRNELLSFVPDQSLLARSFPDPSKLKARMDFLTRYRLSVFREKKAFQQYQPLNVQAGHIESVQWNQPPAQGFFPNTAHVSGRAYDLERRRPAKAVLMVNSEGVIIARSHVNKASDYSQAFWELSLSTAKFPVGPATLEVYALLQDGVHIAPIGMLNLEIFPPADMNALAPLTYVEHPPLMAGCTDHLRAAGHQVYGSGWARNPATDEAGQWVIVMDEAQKIVAYTRIAEEREDVAKQLGNPHLIKSGWRMAFHHSLLKPGLHLLKAYVFLPEQKKALKLLNEFEVAIPQADGTSKD